MTTPAVTDTVLSGLPAFTGLTIFLACAWIIPLLCRRVRLPDVVGLLVVGILLGPSCLNVFHPGRPVAIFLSDVGKLLLMFAAGLEVDLIQFRQTKGRSLCFGLLTFSLPLVAGIALGLLNGDGLNAAILIGSLLASHTLLAFPIVSKLGVVKNEAVTITIGGTVFTDTGALLVLAICVSVHLIGFSPAAIGLQLLQLALYVPFILVGLGMTGRYLFATFKISEEGQLLFLMLVVALSSSLAELIHLEGIVGAFLAGLAVNTALRGTQAKARLDLLANTLFVPAFFVSMGMIIRVPDVWRAICGMPLLVVGINVALIGAKFLAAWCSKLLFHYTWPATLTMWSLSMPQVAATLAAAMVAYQTINARGQRLIDMDVLNAVLVLMLVTSLLGPLLTGVFAKRVAAEMKLET